MVKTRLDLLLVERGLAPTREKAQVLIRSGKVFSGTRRLEKPGVSLGSDVELWLEAPLRFVGRGGVKLDHALKTFGLTVEGLTALDVGASTGGFTDCLLQEGARKVYALDVGHGQLDDKLRRDTRVVSMEKVNFRYLKKEDLPESFDLAVVDVSFISLDKILGPLRDFLKADGWAVVLVKPQFELSAREAPKGIVRSEDARHKALDRVKGVAEDLGYHVVKETESPIRGAKGNHEYFLLLQARPE